MTQCTPQDAAAVAQGLGIRPHGEPSRLSGGEDFATFRVITADGSLVLRIGAGEREAAFAWEVAAMDVARGAGIAVPAVLATGRVGKLSAMAVEFVPGEPLLRRIEQDPSAATRLGLLFGQVQAQLHAAPALGILASAWALPRSPIEERLLRAATGGASETALLHLDFHPLNVLSDGERITGVIDWTNAGGGDPRQDIARTAAILRIETPRAARETMRRFLRGWRRGYEETAGPIQGLAPFLAWAGVRMQRDLALRADSPRAARIASWIALWDRSHRV